MDQTISMMKTITALSGLLCPYAHISSGFNLFLKDHEYMLKPSEKRRKKQTENR